MNDWSKETICIQAGYEPGNGDPRNMPIVQSTTFKYSDSDSMGRLFDLEESGYFYTRLANPTNDNVAKKICELEGGFAAMLTSSGQAANFFAIFNICECGGHVVMASPIYGGTFNLVLHTLKKMGIECTIVSPDDDIETLGKAFKDNTKCVIAETITNPNCVVLDIEKFAKVAHEHGVPLIVDNTFPTPINCNPIAWGADIVTHSTTKYLDGHGVGVGGCIVDSGNFDWDRYSDKFPGMTQPDETYHGTIFTQKFGKAAFITKATTILMRDIGAIQSPQNAYYLNLGIETLHLRMPRHVENATKVARFLNDNPKVAWVNYPGLEGDKYYELGKKYCPNGTCGVMGFGMKGGREASKEVMSKLKMICVVTHVADARTCVLHPASHTHRQMSDEQLIAAGILPEFIRLSVGIENVDDIIADLAQAIDQVNC